MHKRVHSLASLDGVQHGQRYHEWFDLTGCCEVLERAIVIVNRVQRWRRTSADIKRSDTIDGERQRRDVRQVFQRGPHSPIPLEKVHIRVRFDSERLFENLWR